MRTHARLAVVLFALASVGAFAQSPKPMPAETAVSLARAQARAEGKTVFLGFHASWCGWCKRMEAWLAMPKVHEIWDKHFVTLWLDVLESDDKKDLENPGGDMWLKKLNGAEEGIPYTAFLTAEGKVLVDSRRVVDDKPVGNIGYPATPEEIAWFMTMLERAAPKMTAGERATLKAELEAVAKTIKS
ncbi:MAG: thioredoxin family protein [Fimbriimonadaceae bacterium]|nr:thioredoxin family protein [Fimbriimonadaceae bacterium]QYK55057.1 MAG: thioredoxin family protein [Fimbriimonadaceae bacterium]